MQSKKEGSSIGLQASGQLDPNPSEEMSSATSIILNTHRPRLSHSVKSDFHAKLLAKLQKSKFSILDT